MERYSLALNEIYRYNVVAIIDGRGSIDRAQLDDAVATAAKANPGLRVRLRSFLGFSRWVDSGIPPRVHSHSRADWDYLDEAHAGFIHDRFDPLHDGPIADVHLVSGETQSARTALVFRAVHAAVDGGGMSHWMAEVFRALRGDALLGSPSAVTDFQVARSYRAQIQHGIASNPANAPQVIAYSPTVPVSTSDEPLRYVWRVVRIDGQIPNLLPRLALLLCRHARTHSQGHIGFTVPIDYRGLRTQVHSTGNLTGYLRIQVEATDTARAVMVKIAHQVRDHVDCQAPLNTLPVRWVRLRHIVAELKRNLPSMLYEPSTGFPSAGLVSMGHVDLQTYDTSTFSAERIVGIPGSVGRLNIVAGLLPKETVLTLSAPARYNQDGQIDTLARVIAEGLGQ